MAIKTKGTAKGTTAKAGKKDAAPAIAGGVVAKALRFDNVEDKGFGALPIGEYNLVVDKAYTRVSKEKKTPSIAIQYSVEDGEYEGRKVFDDLWWTEAARPMVVRWFKNAQIELPEGDVEIDDIAALIVPGTRIKAGLSVDEQRDSNKVKKYKPAD